MQKASNLPSLFFFFNDTATTEIYTLSLHDALPIFFPSGSVRNGVGVGPPPSPRKLAPFPSSSTQKKGPRRHMWMSVIFRHGRSAIFLSSRELFFSIPRKAASRNWPSNHSCWLTTSSLSPGDQAKALKAEPTFRA